MLNLDLQVVGSFELGCDRINTKGAYTSPW